LDHKRTLKHVRLMSALPPKADIGTQSRNVRFVPKADIQELGASVRGGSGNLLLRRQWKRLILPSQERRDAPHRDAAVCSFGTWGWNLQIMGAIALRCEILRRYAELLTKAPTRPIPRDDPTAIGCQCRTRPHQYGLQSRIPRSDWPQWLG